MTAAGAEIVTLELPATGQQHHGTTRYDAVRHDVLTVDGNTAWIHNTDKIQN